MTSALATWQTVLSYCTAPAYFLLLFVLIRRGLWRAYITFCCFLLVEGSAFSLGLWFGSGKRRIVVSYIYLFAQPILLLLAVMIVLEVFRRVLVNYPGIAVFSQRIVVASLLIGLAVAFALASGDMPNMSTPQAMLMLYTLATRVVYSAVCIFLILIVLFLSWMPVVLPPNTIRHGFFLFFYFLLSAIANLFLHRMGLDVRLQVNLALTLLTLASLFFWMIFLRREGEIAQPAVSRSRAVNTGRYLDKLQELNNSLSRSME